MSAKESTTAPEKKKKESILDLTRQVNPELNPMTIILHYIQYVN